MLYVEFPAQCDAMFVPLVVENPLTGTRCTLDAKVDTGSPYTILPKEVKAMLQLDTFEEEELECVDGSIFKSDICMCRMYIDESGEYVDFSAHIARQEVTMPLLGMDILRKGDTSVSHIEDEDDEWNVGLRFTFQLLPEDKRLLL